MHEEDPKVAKVESPPRLEGRGGDIYYFGVCRGDIITRLAIADVVGHGEVVSEVSQYVYDSLKAHI